MVIWYPIQSVAWRNWGQRKPMLLVTSGPYIKPFLCVFNVLRQRQQPDNVLFREQDTVLARNAIHAQDYMADDAVLLSIPNAFAQYTGSLRGTRNA